MLLVPYVLASIFYLISSFITYSLYYFLLTFKIFPYFCFWSGIVSFGCCSSYCKIPIPQVGKFQLVFSKTIEQCWCMESLPGCTDWVEVCSPDILQSFSWRSNNTQMRRGAGQLEHEHLHLLLLFVVTLFHAPLVSAVSSCSGRIWSQSKSCLTLLLNQRWVLFTYTGKVVIASLTSQLGEAMWDSFYCLAVSLCHLAQLHYIQFFPFFPERRK